MEIIENGLTKARNIPQSELRKSRQPNLDDNIIPFISTHKPNNPQIYNLIKSAFGIVNCHTKMRDRVRVYRKHIRNLGRRGAGRRHISTIVLVNI